MLTDEAANDNRVTELISILSTTLTNIDVEYQFELARIRVTAKPELRAMIVDTVRQRHIERREPYLRQIAELRKRMSQSQGRVACSDRPYLGSNATGT
jgi:phosphoenolpyruvate carboxylase